MEKFGENEDRIFSEAESSQEEISPKITKEESEAYVDRIVEGVEKAPGWDQGYFSRTVELPKGSFVVSRIDKALSSAEWEYKDYECNLMYLLEELGIADDFEKFKIQYEGRRQRLSAGFTPKQGKNPPVEITLRLSAMFDVKKGGGFKKEMKQFANIRLNPWQRSSLKTDVSISNPEEFECELKISVMAFFEPAEDEE